MTQKNVQKRRKRMLKFRRKKVQTKLNQLVHQRKLNKNKNKMLKKRKLLKMIRPNL